MSTGTVKFFNETKGFGFIKDDESGKEYFVHVTGLSDNYILINLATDFCFPSVTTTM